MGESSHEHDVTKIDAQAYAIVEWLDWFTAGIEPGQDSEYLSEVKREAIKIAQGSTKYKIMCCGPLNKGDIHVDGGDKKEDGPENK